MIATGRSALLFSMKRQRISFNLLIPIRITTVAVDLAARLISSLSCPSEVVPVITQKLSEINLFVSEIPAWAGTAIEEEIPEITST